MTQKDDVTVLDKEGQRFQCNTCGQIWQTNLLEGGRRPKNYRLCPNGCNKEKIER